ncbi:DUF6705 family protein [uncultured Psychroserpens sp.]|uniref:DUF6705 family protein n=1 Tax=uncultured Psychroserpens sp. TaxID=255436 RepID=UPI00260CC496|nr:DUF6705 family protein [uncultured Psychroserpens sp.]
MKSIIILISFLVALACKAQNSIVSIYDNEDYGNDGVYYKDIDNDYNIFEGTWVYTNGNTSLTIVLEKKEMSHIQNTFSNYYVDAIIGEYKYIENGSELINTLTNLFVNFPDHHNYNIHGGYISKYGDPLCHDCDPNNIKVYGSYKEPDCDIRVASDNMIFRYFTENGIEKLHINFRSGQQLLPGLNEPDPTCTGFKLPFGEYILIKQ